MVCYCGHSHDALVQSQFNILQGQGVAKTKGKGKGQESSQGNSPKVGKGKGDGKLQPGAVPPSPSGWRSQRKRGAPSEDGSSDAPMNELQERTQTLQAVINSIKGRMDPYAVDLRSMSLDQLAKLRLEANESKSLPQQISISQQVVNRKETAFTEARSKMEQCMANLEWLAKSVWPPTHL